VKPDKLKASISIVGVMRNIIPVIRAMAINTPNGLITTIYFYPSLLNLLNVNNLKADYIDL